MSEIGRMSVNQLLDEIELCEERRYMLHEALVTRASLQEVAEVQFNELAELAQEAANYMRSLQAGEPVKKVWIAQRDAWLERLAVLIDEL
ncbi:hypothetical protein EPA93_04265 [Ktedonosporobacter rubrisoli]|uniref:Uncharacterized protein n=1 Tax=Ktedonosporobacter rubrisoli TaxID=2509675 RepID=A0A4P6JJX6_KTERU|nr:hypothetical protein [Ktedonosporobacter rubrisoli]QBD75250.1 hypothetical protein EPA93_04265 [Ktedonosporobacter rubrisoli]